MEKKKFEQQEILINAVNQTAYLLLDSEIGSFEKNLFKTMGIMATAVGVDRMYIWKNHTIDGKLYCTQVYEWSENAVPQQDNDITINVSYEEIMSGLRELLENGGCINSIVREMLPEHKAQLEPQGIVSILIVPVHLNNQFWGFVGFDDCVRERIFTKEEETVLRSSSLLFAHAYHKNQISREIAEKNELNRVMFSSAPIGLTVFDDKFNIIDCNDATLKMFEVSREFYLNNYFALSPTYQLNGMESKNTMLGYLKNVLSGENIKTNWQHCLTTGELIPCEITMTWAKTADKSLVFCYTYDLRYIKELEMKLDGAKNLIFFDSLTKIYNRRYFDETLTNIIQTLSLKNAHLSVLMLDVDFFKDYNDTYGHQAGDNCLKKVAEILSKSLKHTDSFVARYGGEEFVIVLPNAREKEACLVAEAILKNICNANIFHGKSKTANHITVSIGIASNIVTADKTNKDFIKTADEMLYHSKQNGRNRYSIRKD